MGLEMPHLIPRPLKGVRGKVVQVKTGLQEAAEFMVKEGFELELNAGSFFSQGSKGQ